MGSICLIASFGVYCSLPFDTNPDSETRVQSGKFITLKDILINWSIFTPFVDNFLNYTSWGMIEAMLEPFMRTSLGTGQRAVSFAFLLSGMVYLPFAPLAGWVCGLAHSFWETLLGLQYQVLPLNITDFKLQQADL